MKKFLTTENILILSGLGFIGYWLYKKQRRAITIDPKMGESYKPSEEKKTIVLDISGKRNRDVSSLFPNNMVRDFDSREIKTFAPARTTITDYNDL
jgi:hypothetical protein